jgi:hypothetical protein
MEIRNPNLEIRNKFKAQNSKVQNMAFPYLIISDANYRQFAGTDPGRSFSTGYHGWQRPDAPHAFRGKRPIDHTIPRSRWHDLINAGQGTFLSDLVKNRGIRAKDQNGLGYCWVYGSTRAVEVERAIAGLPFLDLAPESVGGPCTNWRNEGGYASEAFDQLQNHGACESSFLDAPHSLHVNRWKAGWQENAKLHEAVDWYEIGAGDSNIFDEVITCLLNRIPVAAGLDWWGHLVCFLDPVILPDGSVGVLFQNSWGVDWPSPGANGLACLTEDRATPDGAAAPIMVTQSDA